MNNHLINGFVSELEKIAALKPGAKFLNSRLYLKYLGEDIATGIGRARLWGTKSGLRTYKRLRGISSRVAKERKK